MEMEDTVIRMEVDLAEGKKKCEDLQDKLRCATNKEQTVNELHKQLVEGFEKDKAELVHQLSQLRAENSVLKTENADLGAIKIVHESKVTMLERDMSDWREKFNAINCELEDMKAKVSGFENEKESESEITRLKHELEELWETHKLCKPHALEQAVVIQQLQNLQQDTQRMMKTQDRTHDLESQTFRTMFEEMEKKYRSLLTVEAEIRSQNIQMKQDLLEKGDKITDLESRLSNGTDDDLVDGKRKRMHELSKDLEQAKEIIREQNRQLKSLENGGEVLDMEFSSAHLIEKSSTPTKQSPRSRSPRRGGVASPEKLENLSRKLIGLQQLLRLKNKELEEIRTAHDKRLERLKSLQNDHKLLKEQYRSLEDEYRGKTKKMKPLKRTEPKNLQRENSDAVWNELAFFRNENGNLKTERLMMQEELDNLRVMASQDAATIHELQVSLQQEKEECLYLRQENLRLLQPRETALEKLENTQAQLKTKETTLEDLQDQNHKLQKDNDKLNSERRALKTEINSCKREVAEKRIEIADLKRDMARLKREILTLKRKRNSKKRLKKKSPLHRQYKEVLDKESNRLNDENDWEEVTTDSETESEYTSGETITTSGSLGIDIVRAAQAAFTGTNNKPTSPRQLKTLASRRQIESIEEHLKRMTFKNETPVKDVDDSEQKQKKIPKVIRYRDMATSPITVHETIKYRSSTAPIRSKNKQMQALKQRIGSLHQQVQVLRQAKSNLNKENNQMKISQEKLSVELDSCNQRLKTARQQVQKLSADVERLQQQNNQLEQQILETNSRSTTPTTLDTRRSDLDWKHLENRLRVSASEVNKLNNQNKSLKQELDGKEILIRSLQEKINRLERDVSQKRILLEDAKLKFKIAQNNANADNTTMEDMEKRLKSLQETHDRQRTTIESLKMRLAVISKERSEYEGLYRKSKIECDKKAKLLQDSETRTADVEVMMSEIEQTAQQQLRALAKKSEVALDTAQEKLANALDKNENYHHFISSLAQVLLSATQHARTLARQRRIEQRKTQREQLRLQRRTSQQPVPVSTVNESSMLTAQRVAKSILNISQSELDDFMKTRLNNDDDDDDDDSEVEDEKVVFDGDIEADRKRDKHWVKRWERILTKNDFSLPLVDCMMEMMDERVQLLTKI
ncbi:uncharacterized protein LOC141903639 isoform X2 [Tubulanus polymorphus]